jgi:FtsP/CotA-like multicopper oxidase with cupredoxin domain
MTKRLPEKSLSRRGFFKMAGGAVATAAGMGILPTPFKKLMGPVGLADAQSFPPPDLFFGGTDGWMSLPVSPAIPPFHPDVYAPAPFSTYIFGFRNVTGLTDTQRQNQKNKAQHVAPLFWVDQYNTDPLNGVPLGVDFRLQLTNLGLAQRPDLFDAHTIHWHGFRNVIPFFDGEPNGSVAVTTGRIFQYIYRPRDPGTYMFHCHVEDTEHVHMGMTGPVFVRPLQNKTHPATGGPNAPLYPSGKYAYNDGDGSTGYNREFALLLSEVWAESHWADAHIQLPEWSDYRADFSMLNGRVYPDTLEPNSPINLATSIHALSVERDAGGDLVIPAGRPDLQYQPLSALVTCNAGERVLLRLANLGFKESTMTLAGIKMKVVGKDATPMKGRDGTDTSYEANTLSFGAGESFDAIFTAPPHSGGAGPDTYVLYNRSYSRANNLAGGFGGQRTEVRVFPAGTLTPQSVPNT